MEQHHVQRANYRRGRKMGLKLDANGNGSNMADYDAKKPPVTASPSRPYVACDRKKEGKKQKS